MKKIEVRRERDGSVVERFLLVETERDETRGSVEAWRNAILLWTWNPVMPHSIQDRMDPVLSRPVGMTQ